MNWTQQSAATLCTASEQAAKQRQAMLTKPAGSLGQLEIIAIRLAAMQGCITPTIQHPFITVFAADHGIAAEATAKSAVLGHGLQ